MASQTKIKDYDIAVIHYKYNGIHVKFNFCSLIA